MSVDEQLAHWRILARRVEEEVAKAVIGQADTIRLVNVALFARGHVLLEGDVASPPAVASARPRCSGPSRAQRGATSSASKAPST